MGTFFVGKQVVLDMTIEVEADSFYEALQKVEDAWAENEIFVSSYLREASVEDIDLYAGSPSEYGKTLEELCEQ